MKKGNEIRRWIILGFMISLAFSCDTENSIAPPEDSYFKKYYGGEGDQEGVDMVVNSDGSFLLFGTTRNPTRTSQLYLVKADARGKVMWEKTFGGVFDEEARDIELTRNGNIVIVGNTKTVDGDRDILIMTLSPEGVKIDSSGYSLNSALIKLDEGANSVTETNDGFIIAGYTTNITKKPTAPTPANDKRDAIYVRYYSNLQSYPPTWNPVNDSPGTFDQAVKIMEIENNNNNFYFFGSSNSETPLFSSIQSWVFALGSGGTQNGGKIHFGLPSSNVINKEAVTVPNGNGFVMIGSSIDASGDSSIYLAKLRNPGSTIGSDDIEFQKTFASTGNLTGVSIYPSRDFRYLILGNQREGNGNSDIFFSRLEPNLDPYAEPKTFGGSCEDTAGAVTELPDGSIMIIGTIRTGDECESKMALFKLNKEGKFEK